MMVGIQGLYIIQAPPSTPNPEPLILLEAAAKKLVLNTEAEILKKIREMRYLRVWCIWEFPKQGDPNIVPEVVGSSSSL